MTGGGSGNAMRVETTSKQEGMVPFWVLGRMLNKAFVQSENPQKNGNVPSSPVSRIETHFLQGNALLNATRAKTAVY